MQRRQFVRRGLSTLAVALGGSSRQRGQASSSSWRRNRTTIKVVSNWGLEDFAKKLAAEFMDHHPNIKVEFRPEGQFSRPNHDKALYSAYQTGDPFDMVMTGPFYSKWATQAGYTVDPAPLFQRDFGRDYQEKFKEVFVEWEGKLVGVPFKSGTELFYYNRDLIESAGLEVPDRDWTWNDFFQISAGPARTTVSGESGRWGCSVFEPELFRLYVAQEGGCLFSPDYRQATIGTPVGLEALRALHHLIFTLKATGRPIDWVQRFAGVASSWNHQAFYDGKVALLLDGDLRVMRAYQEAAQTGFQVGVAPPLGRKRRAVMAGPTVFQIWKSTDSDRVEAAWEFAKFWLKPHNQARLLVETGNSPLTLAAYRDPLVRKAIERYPGLETFRQAYGYADEAAGINHYPTMALEYLGVRPSVYGLVGGRLTPEEAIREMQTQCQSILDHFWAKADQGV